MAHRGDERPRARSAAPAGLHEKFMHGVALFRQLNFAEAEPLFDTILVHQPDHFGALHLLGIIALQTHRPERGVELIGRALRIDPHVAEAHIDLGVGLNSLKRFDDALANYDKAIAIQPNFAEAHNNRGNTLRELGRIAEALASYDKAIVLKPNYAEAYNNRGVVLRQMKRPVEALASFDKAVALKPNFAEAYNSRGGAFRELKRFDEAEASYRRATALRPDYAEAYNNCGVALQELKRFDEALASYDHAIALRPDYVEAHNNRGNAFAQLKQHGLALAAYERALAFKPDSADAWLGRGSIYFDLKRHDEALPAFDRALALKPNLENGWLGCGNVFAELKRYDEALAAFDKALALKPDLETAWLGCGNVFAELKRYGEAFAAYDKALALKPDFENAWLARGNVFFSLKRYDKAFAAYDRALALDPNLDDAESMRLISKSYVCNWSNFDAEVRHLITSMKDGKTALPFVALAVSDSPEVQLQCARAWVSKNIPESASPIWSGERYRHEKIRIGYFSADFRHHAVAHLIAEMFEKHDKEKFEIVGLSLGPETKDEMQERSRGVFDKFIDVQAQSDKDVALLARNQEIDIAVDLNGFTQNARTGIFSMRPAPIQVSYLGYPGTMGANYIDYSIADRTVIPETSLSYYSEKIVYLPHSYQVNSRRPISESPKSRVESGLPQSSFVFCCFNNNYKITPGIFDYWMRILHHIDDSVLWLFEDNGLARNNLQKEAAARGINPERIIFATRVPLPDHLARHRLADLFLDTLPYNAHTTGSDALWAGLPVLTQIGKTFAGRVAASLLTAIGLPELITHSPQEYEAKAIEFALNREMLLNIKEKLNRNRLTAPLFDTVLFTRHLEAAYKAMYQRYQEGVPPDYIEIQPIRTFQ